MELFPEFDYQPKSAYVRKKPRFPESVLGIRSSTLPLTDATYGNLIQQAKQFRELEPWDKVAIGDLFGVRDPSTDELFLVSTLGKGGGVYALHVHLPPEGTTFWQRALKGDQPDAGPGLKNLRMLECEFINRKEASDEVVDHYKKFDRLPRKRRAFPTFKSYRPGYLPGNLLEHEARGLSLIFDFYFRYMVEVFPRYDFFYEWGEEEDDCHEIPVFCLKEGGDTRNPDNWVVKVQDLPSREPLEFYPVPKNDRSIKDWKHLPTEDEIWEVATVFHSVPNLECERPYFPKTAFCVNHSKGKPVIKCHSEPYESNQNSDTEALRKVFAEAVSQVGYLPWSLRVDCEITSLAFASVSRRCAVELLEEPQETLPDFAQKVISKKSGN